MATRKRGPKRPAVDPSQTARSKASSRKGVSPCSRSGLRPATDSRLADQRSDDGAEGGWHEAVEAHEANLATVPDPLRPYAPIRFCTTHSRLRRIALIEQTLRLLQLHEDLGPREARERRAAMGDALIRAGLLRARRGRIERDGGAWCGLVFSGCDARAAITQVALQRAEEARATGSPVDQAALERAVARNVARFFKRVNREPPVAIPQIR